jgi:hypothetical protein
MSNIGLRETESIGIPERELCEHLEKLKRQQECTNQGECLETDSRCFDWLIGSR